MPQFTISSDRPRIFAIRRRPAFSEQVHGSLRNAVMSVERYRTSGITSRDRVVYTSSP